MPRLFLLLFFALALFGASNYEILDRADAIVAAKNSSTSEIFRAYNDYKNLYVRSMVKPDIKLRKHALYGIVKSGQKLHIDVSTYQKELQTLGKPPVSKPAAGAAKPKVAKSKKRVTVKRTNILRSMKWTGGKLHITFSKKLLSSDINFFKLIDAKKRSFRYVFDIHAKLLRLQKARRNGLKRIGISQYKKGIIRIVIESYNKIDLRYYTSDKKLVINPNLKRKRGKNASSAKTSKVIATPQSYNLFKKVVVIDPGHGGKDTGAIGYKGIKEKDVVLAIAKEVAKELKKRSIKVYLTRTGNTFIKLRKRTKYANAKKADLFISIHANSVPKRNAKKAKGIESYFLSPSRSKRATRVAAQENSKEIEDLNYFGKNNLLNFLNRSKIIASNKLAIDIQRGMLSRLRKKYKGVKDNGVREGPFWVLVGAQMPAVLIEAGFISHPTEALRMADRKYQKILAQGIADGIVRYFINNK